jgi:hypothetical protein
MIVNVTCIYYTDKTKISFSSIDDAFIFERCNSGDSSTLRVENNAVIKHNKKLKKLILYPIIDDEEMNYLEHHCTEYKTAYLVTFKNETYRTYNKKLIAKFCIDELKTI